MTFNKIAMKLKKCKRLIKEEGLFMFIKKIFSIFFRCRTYHIYEKLIGDGRIISRHRLQNYTLKIIHTLKELNKLEKDGYNLELMNLRKKVKKGALPFCVFSGKNLVHVTWVATNETSKKEIDRIPFAVNFQRGEVCTGGSFTDPLHRGKGLLNYTYSYIFPYLAKNGFSKIKFSVHENNIASQKAHAKFNPIIVGKGYYLKIFCLDIWKEIDERVE